MRIFILSTSVLLLSLTAFSKTYFVATNGNDTNAGTKTSPVATVQRAQALAVAGDTVYIRGGTYTMTESQIAKTQSIWAYVINLDKSGTSGKRINYWAYAGEHPVFDFSSVKPAGLRVIAFYVTASWVHFKGIEVTGVQVTITTHTQSECFENRGSNNIYELLSMHDGQAIGIYCIRGSNNLFLNCDAYQNWDFTSETGKGGNVDGFGCHTIKGETGNVFRGCRAWFNSDDGYDLINAGDNVTIENCWAFYNGYSTSFASLGDGNGIKGGGYGATPVAQLPNPIPRHTFRFCLAVGNKANGFYRNHHIGGGDFFNNTAYKNGNNFNMLCRLSDNVTDVPGYGHTMKNNLGYKARSSELTNIDEAQCDLSNNSFDLPVTVTDADFQSLDESLLTQPRQPNGNLPEINFMHLAPGSDLIDSGINVGLPFNGNKPDMGCFETQVSNSSMTIQENTIGFCSVEGTIDNNNAGFTGSGFANTPNAVGKGITWSVSANGGSYTLSWRYSNGGISDRPAKLVVNGSTAISSISFPSTANWSTWAAASVNVTLSAGTNTIRLESTVSSGLGNVDQITITGVNPQPVSCAASGARISTSSVSVEDEIQNRYAVEECLQVYPNPSHQTFTIQASGVFTYTLYDQLGVEATTGSSIDKITIGHNLIPNIYILKINTVKGTHEFRLLKK